jgi:hypothetical protein
VFYTGLSNPDSGPSPNPSFTQISGSNLGGTNDQWIHCSYTITVNADPSAFTSTFRLRFESFLTSNHGELEQVWVDDVVITIDR